MSKQLTYSSYLKVDELLNTQFPLANPPAPDELLFIITHQSYELWFRMITHDLDRSIQFLDSQTLIPCFHLLERVTLIFKNLIQQLDVLETMTPVAFNQFRSQLNPASGFQSWQFREIELLLGGQVQDYAKFSSLEPEWFEKLQTRSRQRNLRDAFYSLLSSRQLLSENPVADDLEKAILNIYQQPHQDELQTLCEFLIELDEQLMLWRFRHVQMVERMIGMKKGTGGSLGVPYLESTLKKKYFPELWSARTQMSPLT